MVKCPFCNQPMGELDSDDYTDFPDFFLCGACRVEQALYWEPWERLPLRDGERNGE